MATGATRDAAALEQGLRRWVAAHPDVVRALAGGGAGGPAGSAGPAGPAGPAGMMRTPKIVPVSSG